MIGSFKARLMSIKSIIGYSRLEMMILRISIGNFPCGKDLSKANLRIYMNSRI
jgi:hypothetical protein